MAWTTYGKQQIFAYAVNGVPLPPLYLALFSGSADPAGTPAELVLAGYTREQVTLLMSATDLATSTADTMFGPIPGGGSYLGMGVYDATSAGNCWFWVDASSSVTIPAGTTVDFAAGQVQVQRV